MSDQEAKLGAGLERLTEWNGEETALWQAALESSKQEAPRRLWWTRWHGLAPVALAACLLLAIVFAIQTPSRRASFSNAPQSAAPAETLAREALRSAGSDVGTPLFKDSGADSYGSGIVGRTSGEPTAARTRISAGDTASIPSAAGRVIVRQASMSVEVSDVRSAFNVIGGLIDGLAGEFVESAVITGEGESTRASIALRVGSERLDAVMRSVRDLGGSMQEQLNASDVTDRVADLDSQLRNERRIEIELLELLSTRADAPLSDVLRIRESLGSVRLTIERLEAQRAALAKQVSLSLLRVELSTKSAAPQEESKEGGAFLGSLRKAFERGGTALGASVVWLVEVLIGGLLVWTVALVVGLWLIRSLRWRMTWA